MFMGALERHKGSGRLSIPRLIYTPKTRWGEWRVMNLATVRGGASFEDLSEARLAFLAIFRHRAGVWNSREVDFNVFSGSRTHW